MSNRGTHCRIRIIAIPWRKACVALPAVALIGGGIAPAVPAGHHPSAAASQGSPAIVVPDAALSMPAVPAGARAPRAPGLALPAGTTPGSPALVALDGTGIPVRALEAYRQGASLVGAADPACHIDWALLAAIGRVESDHARFGGNRLDRAGVARPGIIGIALDGTNGTARIMDTDQGQLDRDTTYDRAVGPMQFIPGTWGVVGTDASGDGVKNPQDLADAAAATAVYLCSGPGDLRSPGDLRAAILRYNPSDSYVRTVTAIADAYRYGVSALPASDLPAAHPAPLKGGSNTTPETRGSAKRTLTSRPRPAAGPGRTVTTRASDTTTPASRPTSPPPPVPAPPLPPVPAPPLPALPNSVLPPTRSVLAPTRVTSQTSSTPGRAVLPMA